MLIVNVDLILSIIVLELKNKFNKEKNNMRHSVSETSFRNYHQLDEKQSHVRQIYRQQHVKQTVAFVKAKREQYAGLNRKQMGMWEALEYLNTIIDESDPDTELSQLDHALQTAEAIRAAGHPRWMILTGLIHDAGKMLVAFDEPQWAVVGDIFVVGCAPTLIKSFIMKISKIILIAKTLVTKVSMVCTSQIVGSIMFYLFGGMMNIFIVS